MAISQYVENVFQVEVLFWGPKVLKFAIKKLQKITLKSYCNFKSTTIHYTNHMSLCQC